MAFSTIDKGSLYQNTVLYTGNNTGQSITGVGFQPDLVWNKGRSAAESHNVWDVLRGTTKGLVTNGQSGESTWATGLTSFDSDGWTMGELDSMNDGSVTYVGWNWKAGGAGSANTDGTINSTVSVNTTAGFSIVKYTGNTTAGATVGHGLGVKPAMIIVKVYDATNNWAVYHKSMGATKAMYLDSTHAETTDAWLNDTEPTSSVFTLSGGNYGNTANNHIAYCFAEVPGFSKFSQYTGAGGSNGAFIYTGFKPSFVIAKGSSTAGLNWFMADNKRSTASGANVNNRQLYVNLNNVDDTNADVDFLSNGFKWRRDGGDINYGGRTYIYMAFGQPIISNGGVSATAR
jgi:hypothetical protein